MHAAAESCVDASCVVPESGVGGSGLHDVVTRRKPSVEHIRASTQRM